MNKHVALPPQTFPVPAMYSSTITEYEDNKGRRSAQLETQNGRGSIRDQPPEGHVPAEQPLIWRNIIFFAVLHVSTIYVFATRYHEAKFWTWIWGTYVH
jgi:hypothetical protein